MSKQFWIVLAVLAVAFIGVIVVTKNNDSQIAASPTNHVEGSASSGVKLVEYGDYQCPACGSFYPAVKEAVTKYQDKIQFQFRNLPLTSLHPNAFAGARAAEAAGMQGKYFQMHDLLYENQQTWSTASSPLKYFTEYAKTLNMNTDQFKKDFASEKVNATIKTDMAAFDKTGAEAATPSFFINGKSIKSTLLVDANGQPSADAFSKVIDQAIANRKK